MYRVIAIIGGALILAGCSTSQFGSLDAFKPAPMMDTVSFETDPPGADAKISNGQTCRTPCALALPTDQPLTVTFALNGYESESETLAPVVTTGEPPRLRPNPVSAELTPAAARPPAAKRTAKKPAKPAAKKPAAKKPAPKTSSGPAAAPSSAPAPTFAPPPAGSSPWPSPPPQR